MHHDGGWRLLWLCNNLVHWLRLCSQSRWFDMCMWGGRVASFCCQSMALCYLFVCEYVHTLCTCTVHVGMHTLCYEYTVIWEISCRIILCLKFWCWNILGARDSQWKLNTQIHVFMYDTFCAFNFLLNVQTVFCTQIFVLLIFMACLPHENILAMNI